MFMQKPTISLVIPMFNEEANIDHAIAYAVDALSQHAIVYSWLIRILFRIYVRDVNFSFKLMRREVLQAIQLRSEGSLIDAEMIVKARNHGFIIQQIGLDYFPRVHGTSHLASASVIFK